MRRQAPVFDDVFVSKSPLKGELGKVIDAAQLLEAHDAIAGNAVAKHDDARQHLRSMCARVGVEVCMRAGARAEADAVLPHLSLYLSICLSVCLSAYLSLSHTHTHTHTHLIFVYLGTHVCRESNKATT